MKETGRLKVNLSFRHANRNIFFFLKEAPPPVDSICLVPVGWFELFLRQELRLFMLQRAEDIWFSAEIIAAVPGSSDPAQSANSFAFCPMNYFKLLVPPVTVDVDHP